MSRTLEADDIKVGEIYFVKFVSSASLTLYKSTSDGRWTTDNKVEVFNDDPVIIISKKFDNRFSSISVSVTVFNLRCESFINLWPRNLRELQ